MTRPKAPKSDVFDKVLVAVGRRPNGKAIGADAARYALARYSTDQSIDLDLDLWARASNDNPVFTVQYAHARVASLMRNAADLGATRGDGFDPVGLPENRREP